MEPKQLSTVYVSLARTHTDCGQYSTALSYYEKELEVWKGNASEECDTWASIAEVRKSASQDEAEVMEAYSKAFEIARRGNIPKQEFIACKSLVRLCKSKCELSVELAHWQRELARLLDTHPEVAADSEEESDSERLDHDSEFETPESLSDMETEEEEEEEEEVEESQSASHAVHSRRAVARKSKVRVANSIIRMYILGLGDDLFYMYTYLCTLYVFTTEQFCFYIASDLVACRDMHTYFYIC